MNLDTTSGVNLSNEQAHSVLALVESEIQTLHNHLASAVEREITEGPLDPQRLVRQLRHQQGIAQALRRVLYPVRLPSTR